MSGGSYDYLYSKGVDELINCEPSLDEMAKDLAESGASKAAEDTAALLQDIIRFREEISVRADKLRDVWHAMEWWRSCDWSAEQFLAEAVKYDSLID